MSFPYKPNTEPPKDMAVFKNIVSVASSSEKFRRVLWTGRNSQVRFPVAFPRSVFNWCLAFAARDYDYPCGWRNRGGK